MQALLKLFVDIALLRAKPQDLPGTSSTLTVAIILAFSTYVIGSWVENGGVIAMQRAALDLSISALFVYGGLYFKNSTARFLQSFSALSGAGAVINVLAIPLLLGLSPESSQPIAVIALLFFYGWSLALCAHVFRHTFDLGSAGGAVVAVIYIVTAIQVSVMVFPPGH